MSRGGLLRLRGALVGTASGVVGVGAHLAGGGMVPDTATAVLVVAACGAVAAAVSCLRRDRISASLLVALLIGGQLVAHAALAISSDHLHAPLVSGPMLAFHLLGVLAALALVRGSEHAHRALAQRICRVLPLLLPVSVPAPPTVVSVPAYRSPLRHWLLVTAGTGTRGPPRVA